MADYMVVADVGLEIINRLKNITDGHVFYGHPQQAADYPLCLFLYDIELLEQSFYAANVTALSLKYMLFANSQADAEIRAVEEQKILVRAMIALKDDPVIKPGNNFLGENDMEISIMLQNISLDDKIKLWNNTGGLRPSLFYSVSPVLVDGYIESDSVRVLSY